MTNTLVRSNTYFKVSKILGGALIVYMAQAYSSVNEGKMCASIFVDTK